MANFGLSKPWIAKYNPGAAYSDAFKCGTAINTSVTPNYNEASLYGDNRQVENVAEFKNANVSLGVDRMPVVASKVMFGHTVTEAGGETSKTSDSANYVGYGFITAEMVDGVKCYRACVLFKAQFKEGEEAYETKGDSIAFKTPTLSGVAMSIETGEWREKSPYFDTEEEADQWIQVKLNVLEQCEVPAASIAGGIYDAAQEIELTTTTKDAKIYYTTNGTTPSAENGTLYENVINIAGTIGLRAVAVKEGAEDSGIMVEEYFITT